jgi:cell division protease FtsH
VTKALLPRDLVKAADHVITLAEPDVDLVLGVVTRLIGDGPAPAVPAAAWSSLSPLELRLARRVGQSADDYISRLVKLLEPLASGPEPVAQAATMTLDDLHGMDEAVEWGRSLAVELAAYAAGELTWSELDRGALLHGPTGTGKTTLAKCIAASCKVPLTVTSYAAWQSFKDGHLGNVVKAMHNAFDEARKVRPSILFIDELDTIGSRADVGYRDDWWRTIINALLEQLDGSADRDGVIVIAATNFPDVIDPAIKRAGRLDREILVPMPDAAALSAIFRLKLGGDLQGVDLKAAGLAAEGSTGADVEKWLRGARRKARQEKRLILLTDVMEEIRGPKDLRSSEFIRRVAIHEAGHAVFSSVHRPGTLVRITVRKTVGSLGAVLEERAILEAMTLEEIEITMRMLLAGRAAEQVILGSVSGGSGGAEQSDLALATIIAMGAHCGYGLGPTLQWHGPPTFAGVPMMMAATPGLAARVEEMLQASYAEAVAFIRQRQVQVEALGDALVEAETLTGAEADAILEQSYLDTPRHRGGS